MKFILMVGLPGSGKSTRAHFLSQENSARIIESDVVRDLYFEGKQDRETHIKVFDKVHEEVLKTLSENHSVICDATNLNYKHRMALINKAKKYNPFVVCDLSMTQLEICVERDKCRERNVGENTIKRMRESFWFPQYFEGIDEININYKYNSESYSIEDFYKRSRSFNQNNPHHTKTLWEHSVSVHNSFSDKYLQMAGMLHDIGKLYTRSTDSSGVSHYINHENVSSYESFFYLKNMNLFSDSEIIKIIFIINYHMRPYGIKGVKSYDKLKNLVGEKLFEELARFNKEDEKNK